MITVFVVDRSAEGRKRLSEDIQRFVSAPILEGAHAPRLSIKSLSPDEIRFHSAPHLVIIGEEIIGKEVSEVAKLRKLFPTSAIMTKVPPALNTLPFIEQLARFGADEVLTFTTTREEFFRKVILLSRNGTKLKSGTLILVDGGKGGVGTTSIAAGLGELCIDAGKKVALVDLDLETQDLSRFFQAKPFVNEQLSLLLNQTQAIIEESVVKALTQVWADDDRLQVMTPPPDGDEFYDSRSPIARLFLLAIEVLDSLFDYVIVDMGHARGSLRRTLYRVADGVVFVVNHDPASLYSSVDKLSKASLELSPDSILAIVENGSTSNGLPSKILKKELFDGIRLDSNVTPYISIPDCSSGRVWPASGSSMYARGKRGVRKGFEELGKVFGVESNQKHSPVRKFTPQTKALPAQVISLPSSTPQSSSRDDKERDFIAEARKLVSGAK